MDNAVDALSIFAVALSIGVAAFCIYGVAFYIADATFCIAAPALYIAAPAVSLFGASVSCVAYVGEHQPRDSFPLQRDFLYIGRTALVRRL